MSEAERADEAEQVMFECSCCGVFVRRKPSHEACPRLNCPGELVARPRGLRCVEAGPLRAYVCDSEIVIVAKEYGDRGLADITRAFARVYGRRAEHEAHAYLRDLSARFRAHADACDALAEKMGGL